MVSMELVGNSQQFQRGADLLVFAPLLEGELSQVRVCEEITDDVSNSSMTPGSTTPTQIWRLKCSNLLTRTPSSPPAPLTRCVFGAQIWICYQQHAVSMTRFPVSHVKLQTATFASFFWRGAFSVLAGSRNGRPLSFSGLGLGSPPVDMKQGALQRYVKHQQVWFSLHPDDKTVHQEVLG